MDKAEALRAQAEARRSASGMTSAERARLWAGLNRYMATEARREQKVAEQEQEPGEEPADESAEEPESSEEQPSKPRE